MERNFDRGMDLFCPSLFADKKVGIIWAGGIGSNSAYCLAKMWVKVKICDFDEVDITNINRQIIALESNVGLKKVDVFEKRIKEINKECEVIKIDQFITVDNLEELFKYVFFEQIEVVAETEDEFILKTLKNRYGENFTCDVTKIKHAIDQKKQRMTIRPCTSANGTEITVQSFEYEPSLVQYTIIEDYLDKRYFSQLKEELETKVVQSTMASSVQISLYSSENCNLVADCVDCEEYLKNKNELNDRKNQYEASTKLNFQKDLTINAVDFANNGKYKYVITINGNYAGYQSAAFDDVINKTLTTLNSYGVKNTYGYEITIKSGQSLGGNETYNTEVYKVKGEASEDKTFKNPVIVE